jgi:hypothetical protein
VQIYQVDLEAPHTQRDNLNKVSISSQLTLDCKYNLSNYFVMCFYLEVEIQHQPTQRLLDKLYVQYLLNSAHYVIFVCKLT